MKTELRGVPRFFVVRVESCVSCDARTRLEDSVYCRACEEIRVLRMMRYAISGNDN